MGCDPFDEGGESLHAKGQCSGGFATSEYIGTVDSVDDLVMDSWNVMECHGSLSLHDHWYDMQIDRAVTHSTYST